MKRDGAFRTDQQQAREQGEAIAKWLRLARDTVQRRIEEGDPETIAFLRRAAGEKQ